MMDLSERAGQQSWELTLGRVGITTAGIAAFLATIMAAARCVRASDAAREPGHSFYPRRLAESYCALAKAMRARLGLDSIHVDVDGGEEW